MNPNRSDEKVQAVLFEGNPETYSHRVRHYKKVYYSDGACPGGHKVAEDLFTYVDFHTADYLAGKKIEWVYNRLTAKRERKLLNELLGSENGHLFLKKHILLEIGKIYTARIYVNKFIARYGKPEHLDFIPKDISFEVYQTVKKKEKIFPSGVRIPDWYLKRARRKESLKRILCRYAILGFPFFLAFFMTLKRTRRAARQAYQYGVHVWDSGTHHFLPPYTISFFDRLKRSGIPVLYIIESDFRGNMDKDNLAKLKQGAFDVCYFFDMIRQIDIWKFFSEIYSGLVRPQIKLFGLRTKKATVRYICIKLFMKLVLWELFFSKYSVRRFISLQTPDDISNSLIQKQKQARSSFIFFSSSYDCIPREDINALSDSQYSHMYYNDFISSRVSIEYFKKNMNLFDNYLESGILSSDYAYQVKRDDARKAKIKNDLGIPEKVKVVGLFDTTIGRNGMFDLSQGSQMAEDFLKLIAQNRQLYFIFKTRTANKLPADSHIVKVYDQIKNSPRVCFIGNASDHKSTELMGICDLVISAYSSSVSLEAASGGIKAVYYTPENFMRREFVITSFPRFCATNHCELQDLKDYWLNECNESAWEKFQNDYLKPYIDSYCDGNANNRLARFLR